MSLIYHLAPATRWSSWPTNEPYFPAQYEKDGFIHCTSDDEMMLKVSNHFHRNTSGDYVLLVIDPGKLQNPSSPIQWEKATRFDGLFPHIHGPIDRNAIVEIRNVQRSNDGTFVGWSKTE